MQLPEEKQQWRRLGKCTDLSTTEADRLFFYGAGGSPVRARGFCNGCLVKRQCLHFAIVNNQDGVWAGTTKEERQELIATGIVDRIIQQGLIQVEIYARPDPEPQEYDLKQTQDAQSFLNSELTGSAFPTAHVKAS